MTGVILCGGESSRMGTDKGLIELQEGNWAQIVAKKFELLSIPFVVSVNAKQYNIYSNIFTQKQLLIDNETINAKGPLLGLLSVHKAMPKEDIFVIACDMIDIELPPLQLLLSKYKSQEKFDTYLFAPNNSLQPVCTIYTTNFLNIILNKIKNNELKMFGLKYLLEGFNNSVIIPPTEWLPHFNNYNSQEDLNRFNK